MWTAPTAGAPVGSGGFEDLDSKDQYSTIGGSDCREYSTQSAHWNSSVPPAGACGPGAVLMYRCTLPTDATEMGKECPVLTSHLKPDDAIVLQEDVLEVEAGRFGHCVSVSRRGTWLAVGAPHATRNDNKKSGAVFVYANKGEGVFTLDREIVSDYSLENDRFGWSCSVDELRGDANYSAVLVCGCWASAIRDKGRGGGFIQIYQRMVHALFLC
jgi:hypothetical protein